MTTVVLTAAVLMTALMSWQLGQAQARVAGTARHLAAAVAAEGYGLHHWLHGARAEACDDTPPTPACLALSPARAHRLDAAQRVGLAAHGATAPWRRDGDRIVTPRGWNVVPLIGAEGQGVIVLRPLADVIAAPTWDALNTALEVTLGARDGDRLAAVALPDFEPDEDRAYLASRFARLDTNAVLREAHAGHGARAMETALTLDGNGLLGLERLEADSLSSATPVQVAAIPGPLTVDGTMAVGATMTLAQLDIGGTVTVPGPVSGLGAVRTGTMVVTGTTALASEAGLLACIDPDTDLCGGGDLDLTAASGAPGWDDAVIFGDVTLREGNRLTDVGAVRAQTGIFETLDIDRLSVTGCLRSVTPFIYGARC